MLPLHIGVNLRGGRSPFGRFCPPESSECPPIGKYHSLVNIWAIHHSNTLQWIRSTLILHLNGYFDHLNYYTFMARWLIESPKNTMSKDLACNFLIIMCKCPPQCTKIPLLHYNCPSEANFKVDTYVYISSNDSAWKSYPSSIVYCDQIWNLKTFSVKCIRQEQNPAGIDLHCDTDDKLAAIIN